MGSFAADYIRGPALLFLTLPAGRDRGSIEGVEIRRIEPVEWERLREIRLKALADAPDAFGTTYEDAADQSDAYWHGMLEWPAWVAEEDDRWLGLVRVVPEEGEAQLVSMWVEPEARNRGIGQVLIEKVVQWARAHEMPAVTLWVTEGNPAAAALYRKAGFVDTGDRQPLPSNQAIQEHAMRLELGSTR